MPSLTIPMAQKHLGTGRHTSAIGDLTVGVASATTWYGQCMLDQTDHLKEAAEHVDRSLHVDSGTVGTTFKCGGRRR